MAAVVDQNCFGCQKMIREKNYKTLSQRFWHANCFKCGKCKDQIDAPETATFTQSQVFCTVHIENGEIGTNVACPVCNVAFLPSDKNLVNANRNVYHPDCFKCSVCSKVIPEKEDWKLHKNLFHCKGCYDKNVVFRCCKCTGELDPSRHWATKNGLWCKKCFICTSCRRPLSNTDKINEIVGVGQLYCEHCNAAYTKANYALAKNRPGP